MPDPTEDGIMRQQVIDNLKTLIQTILFLFVLTGASAQEGEAKFRLNVESFLLIKGSSNINKFECRIDGANIKKEIDVIYKADGHALDFHKFRIELEVDHFDCRNDMITSDFKKSLKADQFPVMTIDFVRIIFPKNDDPFEDIYPTGIFARVSLTDQKKKYYIGLERESLEERKVRLKGNLAVDMRDFGLEPPSKMLSLIKVNPLLDINFSLSMTRVEPEN